MSNPQKTPAVQQAWTYDEDGYLVATIIVQESPLEPGVWLLPKNSTTVDPQADDQHFCRWDAEAGAWVKEKKPTTAADFEGVSISHTSRTPHDEEMRALIQKIVTADCKTHRIVRGDALEWGVEKIPEKTSEELQQEAEERVRAQRDYLIGQTDYLLAADYPIDAESLEAVKAYRQALRDVPQQEGFPENVEWPTMPEVTKVQ